MKTLVAYSSKTGNTKKVAEAIASTFKSVDLLDIKDVETLDNYDLVVVGTWIDKATADAKAKRFIEGNLKGRKVAYFFTLGAYPDSDHAKDCNNNITKILEDNGNEIVARYHCQGAIDPKLMEWMSQLPADHPHAPDEARLKRWKDAGMHPNQEDFDKAKDVFKAIV